jgi:hypothetical protein
MPNEMFDSITTAANDDEKDESELEHNFRRTLKAKCMHLGTPLQLVREKTILITKFAGDQQDPATKAWNFCTALYYKGNRTIPWRLVEDTAKLRSCYIGIGFYKSRDGETVSSSLAQVFDEFGHGIILRGTPVSIDKRNRHPYLSEDQAYELLRNALEEYDRALEHMPARIVIHKSSRFRDGERKDSCARSKKRASGRRISLRSRTPTFASSATKISSEARNAPLLFGNRGHPLHAWHGRLLQNLSRAVCAEPLEGHGLRAGFITREHLSRDSGTYKDELEQHPVRWTPADYARMRQ